MKIKISKYERLGKLVDARSLEAEFPNDSLNLDFRPLDQMKDAMEYLLGRFDQWEYPDAPSND